MAIGQSSEKPFSLTAALQSMEHPVSSTEIQRSIICINMYQTFIVG